ncbi:YfiR family protein [Vibrio hannami]|uniref:YfiR family protein n=1 Tax=Vibrio hannami TaxID=2717094 RepID=UPI00240FE8B2|nr:YfiR family protein [Vibrio hannami]MDG3085762.1 YfiR family protein [Vibrio hannami]
MLIILSCFAVGEATANGREYALKAGFIYNFARFSEGWWFEPAIEKTYRICSNDAEFIGIANQALSTRSIKNRPVVLKLISKPDPDCHSLYISNKQPFTSINNILESHTGMLIGEEKNFIDMGGHLSFFITGGKIRFEVSPQNLKQAGIKLSSKVLRLGRVVEDTK